MELASLPDISGAKLRDDVHDTEEASAMEKPRRPRGIDRICCVRIKRDWKIRKQLLISMMVLFTIVFALLSGMLAVITIHKYRI